MGKNKKSSDVAAMIKEAYETAKEKGWHDKPVDIMQYAALINSELGEAMEELRKNTDPTRMYSKGGKPEGFAVEIADYFIRIFDMIGDFVSRSDDSDKYLDSICSSFAGARKEFQTNAAEDVLSPTQLICFLGTSLFMSLDILIGLDESEDYYHTHGVALAAADKVFRHHGIDIYQAIESKMQYNRTRDYRHGGREM